MDKAERHGGLARLRSVAAETSEDTFTADDRDDVIRGKREAIDRFIRQFAPILKRTVHLVCLRYGIPGYAEDDFLQDIIVSLFAKDAAVLRRWDPERGGSFKTYLSVVARSRTLEVMRRWGRELPVEDEWLQRAIERDSNQTSEIDTDLESVLDQYRTECSDEEWAFVVRLAEGANTEELSSEFCLSPAAVYKRTSRVRVRLQKMLNDVRSMK